jgi:glycosyltransferase involved in cell wall biosynthesis
MSEISILIRTFNSARTLEKVISRLDRLEGDEIILVDSGSTDRTLRIGERLGARIVRAEGKFNYSKSLNLGFHAARHPWVLTLSSHAVPVVPNFLELFRRAMRELPADVMVAYAPCTLDGRGLYADDTVRVYTRETYGVVNHLCGNGNALYRRAAWELVPFDETIRTGEDKLWLRTIFARGYRIALASGPRALNINHYSLRYMFMKGYSDYRSEAHQPMSILHLFLGLARLTKKFIKAGGRMPVGNWIRWSAHHVGCFFGSYQEQDNRP